MRSRPLIARRFSQRRASSAKRSAPARRRARRRARDGLAGRRPRRARSRARACAAGRGRRARARAARARPAAAPRSRARRPRGGARARRPRRGVAGARSATPRREAARSSRSVWCSGGAGARDVRGRRARERGEQACARDEHGACAPWRSRARGAAQRGPRLAQSSGTASSAAWVGVEQLAAATSSSSVRSVWWPIEAITGTAQQRDGAAERLVGEREQVGRRAAAAGHHDHLDRAAGGQLAQRGADPRRRVAVLDRRERPDDAAPPSRAGRARRAGPRGPCRVSAQTTPIVRGSSARGSARWRSSRPSAASARRRCSIWASRSPSPATRRSLDREAERGRGARAARVVVAAAGDDHLGAVAQRARSARRAAPSRRATSRRGSRRRRRAARSTRAPASAGAGWRSRRSAGRGRTLRSCSRSAAA